MNNLVKPANVPRQKLQRQLRAQSVSVLPEVVKKWSGAAVGTFNSRQGRVHHLFRLSTLLKKNINNGSKEAKEIYSYRGAPSEETGSLQLLMHCYCKAMRSR